MVKPESLPPTAQAEPPPAALVRTPLHTPVHTPVPEGYAPMPWGGPYFRALGDVYCRAQADGTQVVALRVAPQHLNVQGVTHGGMLTTLADGALGVNLGLARGRRGAQVTVSLTADFLSGARAGDWLEAHVQITRLGKRLAYANCNLMVGSRQVLRASAVFSLVDRPLPEIGAASGAAPGEAPVMDG